MKKVMVSLIVICLMLIAPLSVLADVRVTPSIPNDPTTQKDNDKGFVKTTNW